MTALTSCFRPPRPAVAAALGLSLALAAPGARAEATREQQVLAETLFREAKTLLAQKKVPEACRKLEESQRLDPGGGTLLALALCHEQEGKTATAWSEFQEAATVARAAKRKDRERIATERSKALEPRLSRLTVSVAEREDRPGYEVMLDGVALGKAAWGTAMPVDPGTHTLSASAPDRKPWSQRVEVGPDGDRQAIAIPLLEVLPPPPPEATASEPRDEPRPIAAVEADGSWPWSTKRTAGIVLAGVGAVGVGVGAYFGLRAFSKNDESKAGCQGGLCNAAGWEAYQDGKTAATVSTIALPAGIALAGLGAFFIVTSLGGSSEGPAEGARPRVRVAAGWAPGGAALSVGGAF